MIYVLEDDESIRELIIYTLNGQNMQAKGFGTPSEFWDAVHEKTPSLVLLDIMLPEEDGFSILQKLRAAPDQTFAGYYADRKRKRVRYCQRTGYRSRRLCSKAIPHDGVAFSHPCIAAPQRCGQ